jgi:hypothetical protein
VCCDVGNQEDFSIYSQDQATSPDDPWSGGRALKGLVRPRPLVIQGEVLSLEFARIAARFQCALRTPPTLAAGAPEAVGTVFYIPRLQYPHGFDVAVTGDAGVTVLQDELAQRLVVAASAPHTVITVVVTPRRRPPPPRSFSTLVRSWMT